MELIYVSKGKYLNNKNITFFWKIFIQILESIREYFLLILFSHGSQNYD